MGTMHWLIGTVKAGSKVGGINKRSEFGLSTGTRILKPVFIRERIVPSRFLRDSQLDLEIETLKVNSRLILDLDSQFFHKNSHSHSRLSISSSQKYESQEI